MVKKISKSTIRLLNQARSIISDARQNAVRTVDFQRVLMYWNIGKVIFEEEQQGHDRAEYGSNLIKNLSKELEPEFGTGFSMRQLELSRQFYRTYSIANALRSQLNWTQYRLLIRIENEHKREYYLTEASKNNWTARQLERQINSRLYERLLLSNKKERVLAVASGQVKPETASDIIKDPMYLEFLGMKPQGRSITKKTWFSVVDIIRVLTQQKDYQKARKYWNKLKERLGKEGNQSVTNCHRLKMTAADGKL